MSLMSPPELVPVLGIAVTAWRRAGLAAPEHEGDVEAAANDAEDGDDGATASVWRDALAVAGFSAFSAAVRADVGAGGAS